MLKFSKYIFLMKNKKKKKTFKDFGVGIFLNFVKTNQNLNSYNFFLKKINLGVFWKF
jgi:hypothetical protein